MDLVENMDVLLRAMISASGLSFSPVLSSHWQDFWMSSAGGTYRFTLCFASCNRNS